MTNPTTITANPGEQVVDVERVIDAPIADVYRAYTEPELVSKWLGPRGFTMDISEWDVRAGGSWAFVHHGDGGHFAFRGVYHSIEPRVSMLQTFEYLGAPGHVSLERIDFEDLGASTRVHIHAVYQSLEDRDGMIESGMARGMTEGFEQLDELLVKA